MKNEWRLIGLPKSGKIELTVRSTDERRGQLLHQMIVEFNKEEVIELLEGLEIVVQDMLDKGVW